MRRGWHHYVKRVHSSYLVKRLLVGNYCGGDRFSAYKLQIFVEIYIGNWTYFAGLGPIPSEKSNDEILATAYEKYIADEKEEAKNMVKSSLDRSKLTSIQQKVYDIIIND